MDVRDRSQNWWAGMRRVWEFTQLSETEERCDACGVVLARSASAMKAHHQSHLSQRRGPR